MFIDFDHASYGYRGFDLAMWVHSHDWPGYGHTDYMYKFAKRINLEMEELMNGYANVTRENVNDIYKEICAFLPYIIIDEKMVGWPIYSTMALWLKHFNIAMTYCK